MALSSLELGFLERYLVLLPQLTGLLAGERRQVSVLLLELTHLQVGSLEPVGRTNDVLVQHQLSQVASLNVRLGVLEVAEVIQ